MTNDEREYNDKLLSHLTIDIEQAVDIFKTQKVIGFVFSLSYDDAESGKHLCLGGMSGDVVKTLQGLTEYTTEILAAMNNQDKTLN